MKTQQLYPETFEQAHKQQELGKGKILFCIHEIEPVFYQN